MDVEQVVVRRAGRSDVELVLSAADLLPDPPTPEWTRDVLDRGSTHLVLALDRSGEAENPLGLLLAVEAGHPGSSPDLFVYLVQVRPEHRHLGIAHRMIRKAVDIAEESGCGRVCGSLTVRATEPIASPLSPPDSVATESMTFVIPVPDL